jgi:hypothetical protein
VNIRKLLAHTSDVPNDNEHGRSGASNLYAVKSFFHDEHT